MAGFFDSLVETVTNTIIGKATGAVGAKVGQGIDAASEYTRKLARLKKFASHLVGLTEAEAAKRCEEQGLRWWAIRRDDRDFSFGGTLEKRYDRILGEVDNKKVTNAYFG